ncbi:MAG: hypothetical protein A4E56_02645 [Pelotomaculum sp. PtaU1.Bin065]|nr:MAG: hypothetical protein A4E56_02645 [Pelotomaculum sp. PtaU1.Bin065]
MAVDTALPSLEELQEVLADELDQEREQTFAARLAADMPSLLEQMETLDIKKRLSFFKESILPETAWLNRLDRDNVIHEVWRLLKPIGISKDSIREEVAARIPKDEPLTTKSGQEHKKPPDVYNKWIELLAETRYCVDGSGFLCYKKHLQDGDIEEVPVANFLARPTKEISRDDGAEIEKTFEIVGLLAPGIPLPACSVVAKDFNSMSWIVPAWGLGPNLEPGAGAKDRLRHAIQCLSNNITRETVFTHVGWRRINGEWIYLHGGGSVGGKGIITDLSVDKLERYTLPETTDPEAIRWSLKLLDVAPAEVVIPLFALTFLAPLCEPLRKAGYEPAFVAWLVGTTGAMKSTLAGLFMCHFGEFTGKNLPASFRDTGNAIERKGFLVKDSVLCIDDYHPVSNQLEARKMQQTAQQILRQYGDRVGRGRMQANTKLRASLVPRGLALVTGEDMPTSGQSTTARFLGIELKKGDIDTGLLTELQANAGKLAQAMYGYLQWLAPGLDKVSGDLLERFNKYRQKATAGEQHSRLPEVVAWLYTGLLGGLNYAKSVGAIDKNTWRTLLDGGWKVLMELADRQGARITEERPTIKFLNVLSELLTSGSAYVQDVREPAPRSEIGFIGWKDNDWLYLLPDSVYKTVAQFCVAQGGVFPVTSKTLWKHLESEGLIFVSNEGGRIQRTVRETIGGQRQRVLKLLQTALQN